MENESDGDTNCGWKSPQSLEKRRKKLEIKRRIEINQTTALLRQLGDLVASTRPERLAVI